MMTSVTNAVSVLGIFKVQSFTFRVELFASIKYEEGYTFTDI